MSSRVTQEDLAEILRWLESMPACLAYAPAGPDSGDPHGGQEMANQLRRGFAEATHGDLRIQLTIQTEHSHRVDFVVLCDVPTEAKRE